MLTYCTNIHSGESWSEVFEALRTHFPEVRRQLSATGTFPLGLRLSAAAAAGIGERENAEFLQWCDLHSCFVATINGFPYGRFHGAPVKKGAYFPPWSMTERADYTILLSNLLARWLPPVVQGSISTVPLACRGGCGKAAWPMMRENVLKVGEHLRTIHDATGKTIVLSFEPEPGCLLETGDDALRFFDLLDAPEHLRPFLGVCLDACHEAVQFRNPAASLRRLLAVGVPVGKVQLSSAPVAGSAEEAAAFFDPVYQHQTCVSRGKGPLLRYADLPQALSAGREGEWRMHYHLPLVPAVPLRTTAGLLPELIGGAKGILLETEVYTWDILPPQWRGEGVARCIVSDLRWAGSFL